MYPVSSDNDRLEPKMISLFNAICADKLIFNTKYNATSFLNGIEQFLKRMPDGIPKNTIEYITKKLEVIAVPINMSGTAKDLRPHNKSPFYYGTIDGNMIKVLSSSIIY